MTIYTYVVDHGKGTPLVDVGAPIHGGRLVAVQAIDALARVTELEDKLREIGDYAHAHSTGPTVPDACWEVRRMAYDALGVRPDSDRDYL